MAAAVPVFVTVFLITMVIATAVTFILPESFASTARIKLDQSLTSTNTYDPYFIQTEFEVIQSQVVLEPTIAKLNLNVEWGKKYFNGETLKTSEALEILKGRLSLAPVRGTKLIAITVYSDDRREAAAVANAVAEAYQDYSAGKNNKVEIIDRAEPGQFPVKPNKPLNIILGAVAGIFLGALAAAIVGFFASRKK
ncbi:MAG TPA: GNVR domain-containing protein [Verrucomicrobiae bacterium]